MVKLLIADDNKQITAILKEYSEKDGYEAVVAYDGEQALQEFAERQIRSDSVGCDDAEKGWLRSVQGNPESFLGPPSSW